MTFADIFGQAVDSRVDENAMDATPSIDILSRSAFIDALMGARHNALNRDMFQSIVADDAYAPLIELGQEDYAPADATVVENLPDRGAFLDSVLGSNPDQELGLDFLTSEVPSARDIVRRLLGNV